MDIYMNDLFHDDTIEMCSFQVPFKYVKEDKTKLKLKATVTYPRDINVHLKAYLEFLSTEGVKSILAFDVCYVYADKYLLAMVFKYFIKAGVEPKDYSAYLFLVALCLAHDIAEEGLMQPQGDLSAMAAGESKKKKKIVFFNKVKMQLFKFLNYQANVSREWCEKIFAIFPDHAVWQRNRDEGHAGAMRAHIVHLPGGESCWDWVKKPTCWRCASATLNVANNISSDVSTTEIVCSESGQTQESSPKMFVDSWGSPQLPDDTSEVMEEDYEDDDTSSDVLMEEDSDSSEVMEEDQETSDSSEGTEEHQDYDDIDDVKIILIK